MHVRDDALSEVLPQIQTALRESAGGTLLTVAISEGDDVLLARLCALGFRRVMADQSTCGFLAVHSTVGLGRETCRWA